MNGEIRWVKKSQFALEQGWSPSYVTKLIQQGRIVLDAKRKLVNVAATLALLADTDHAKFGRERRAGARVQRDIAAAVAYDASGGDESLPPQIDPKFWDSRARREGALAEIAVLELAKRKGELCRVKDVERIASMAGRLIRDMMLGIPVKIAPVIAAMTDSFAIELMLRAEISKVCDDTAKTEASDILRLAESAKILSRLSLAARF